MTLVIDKLGLYQDFFPDSGWYLTFGGRLTHSDCRLSIAFAFESLKCIIDNEYVVAFDMFSQIRYMTLRYIYMLQE